jgi:hypothetical protein
MRIRCAALSGVAFEHRSGAAIVSDSAGAQLILDRVRKQWPLLKHLFADGAYARTKLLDKAVFREMFRTR